MDESAEIQGEEFWKDLPTMMDYFGPVVSRMQKHVGISSESLLKAMGRMIGEKMVGRLAGKNEYDLLGELADLWRRLDMGRIEIDETDPLTFTVHDCMICGQIPEGGSTFNCAFHEGFFEQVLHDKVGPDISIRQIGVHKDDGNTWGRSFQILHNGLGGSSFEG